MKKIIFSLLCVACLQISFACAPPVGYSTVPSSKVIKTEKQVPLFRIDNREPSADCQEHILPIKKWSLYIHNVRHDFSPVTFPFAVVIPFVVIYFYATKVLLILFMYTIRTVVVLGPFLLVIGILLSLYLFFKRKNKKIQ